MVNIIKEKLKIQRVFIGQIQETKKERKKIAALCIDFALRITRENSFLKLWMQFLGEGRIPSKMKSFLCIQILNQKRIIISMKKEKWSCCLISPSARNGSDSLTKKFCSYPASFSKGASEEQVRQSFLTSSCATSTKIGWQMHMSSSQEFPCANSISKEVPKENFMFILASLFP